MRLDAISDGEQGEKTVGAVCDVPADVGNGGMGGMVRVQVCLEISACPSP